MAEADESRSCIDELRSRLALTAEPAGRLAILLELTGELSDTSPLECEPLLAEALTLARSTGDRAAEANAERFLANVAWHSGRMDEVALHAGNALSIARAAGERQLEASALSLLGILYRTNADYEQARRCCEECRRVSAEARYPRGVQSALNELGNIAMLQGRLEDALACYQECFELHDDIGDPSRSAVLLINIGLVQEQLGRWEDAAGNLYRAIVICERGGYSHMLYAALNVLGELFLKRDRLSEAIDLLSLVADAGRRQETTQDVMRDALGNLGLAQLRSGDLAAAGEAYREAVMLAQSASDRRAEVIVRSRQAELAVALGDAARADAAAATALGLARELRLRVEEGEALRMQAQNSGQRGDTAQARTGFESALDLLSEAEDSYELARTRLQYGRLLAGQGEREPAREYLRSALKSFRRLAVVAEAVEASRLLFRLDVGRDRDMALLQAVSELSTLGLEPTLFTSEALSLLCEGLGFAGGGLIVRETPAAVSGRLDSAALCTLAADEEARVSRAAFVFPVRSRGQKLGAVCLVRGAAGAGEGQPELNMAIIDAIASLLAVPVQRLCDRPAVAGARVAGIDFSGYVGASARFRSVLADAAQAAGDDAPLLVLGEPGTGRRRLGQAIHRAALGREGRLAVVNCAAAAGLADAGLHPAQAGAGAVRATVLLVDVDAASTSLQQELLVLLDSSAVELPDRTLAGPLRFIATSSGSPDALAGLPLLAKFALRLWLPPLREMKEDLAGLVAFLAARCSEVYGRQVHGASPEVLARFADYGWPGNVRELRRVIERAVLLATGKTIVPADLPERLGPS